MGKKCMGQWPYCIWNQWVTATHLAGAATHLAGAACISSFNYTHLQAYINYISFTFQAFIKLQVPTSTGECGRWKGKKATKRKTVLPSLSSDDDHDEHDDATPNVPDVPINSTPTTPSESPVEPPSKTSKKMRQLTAKEEDKIAEWLRHNLCIYINKLDSYCQTDMKKRLWIEKAPQEFPNIDVEYLMSWCNSMRTRFGKLSRLPTGSGAQDLTEREEGILRKFCWLKTHISRQRGKQLGGLT